MTKKIKSLIFSIALLLLVFFIIEAIGYMGMWLNSQSFDFLSNRHYWNIRSMLLGDSNPELYPKYLTLPYLGYIPFPGYQKNHIVQHNKDGYRGKRIPFQKTRKLRVLCMGGSTTYGFGVDSPAHAYPAQLSLLLNRYLLNDSLLSIKYSEAEVINAGLEGGTSAEELQQYLFKYRYYKPDVVIVHSGINDALLTANAGKEFQLDYTHSRRLNFHLEPLSAPAHWLMKSYLISFITIRLFYTDFSKGKDEFKPSSNHIYSKWSSVNMDTIVATKRWIEYPFYNNTAALYREIAADSLILVVVPNVLNEKDAFVQSNKKYKEHTELNAYLSKLLAQKFNGVRIDYDYRKYKSTDWIDDCHVNKHGEQKKAEFILPFLINALSVR